MKDVGDLISGLFGPLKVDYPDLNVTVTGQIPLMNKLSDYISWSQIKSFGITLIVISVILLIVLGSMRIGVIAIIPNLFPILAIFGLMGYLKVPLEIHLLLVAPITIGIAVDDTIHFLTHYRLEMKQHGDIQRAIRNIFREVGQAIVFTSLILSIGFLSYLLSVSTGFVYFGIFSGIAMLVALLADLFLLPAMLVLFRSRNCTGGNMNTYQRITLGFACVLSLALFPAKGYAPDSAGDAREIMQKVLDRDDGTTQIARVKLSSFRYTKQGNTITRAEKPRIKTLGVSYIIMTTRADRQMPDQDGPTDD